MKTSFRTIFFLVLLFQGIACNSSSSDSSYDWSRSLESLTQVDGFPLYVMHYYGDYDLPGSQTFPTIRTALQFPRPLHYHPVTRSFGVAMGRKYGELHDFEL